jgi:hypothetical protein
MTTVFNLATMAIVDPGNLIQMSHISIHVIGFSDSFGKRI